MKNEYQHYLMPIISRQQPEIESTKPFCCWIYSKMQSNRPWRHTGTAVESWSKQSADILQILL